MSHTPALAVDAARTAGGRWLLHRRSWLAGALTLGGSAVFGRTWPARWPSGAPTGAEWLEHARRDLLPWWTMPDAQGVPRGRFPTFRCHDGSAYDAASPCPELAKAPGWVHSELGRDHVRMQARQTYAYAMGFHLTGDPALLELARAGVADLRARSLDADGSAVSWHGPGGVGPPPGLRTAQDLAYAGVGLAAMYYLTRDGDVLADLVRLKDHVFARYRDPASGLVRWVADDDGSGEARRDELVATLDQLNAYLILVTPVLPDGALRRQWRRDVATLSAAMVARYHDPLRWCFFGSRGAADSESADGRHNDFGHTVKAYWMLYLGARLNRDAALRAFAREGMRRTLDAAWLADSGTWGDRWRADGSVEPRKTWWIYAELDQAAATLAVCEGDDATRWARASRWWLDHFVDRARGEVWPSLAGDGTPAADALKQHHWKNGFHSMEHAVIGYLAAQALAGQPATLHFAVRRPDAATRWRAYTFDAVVRSRRTVRVDGQPLQRIGFELERANTAGLS